MRYKIVLEKPIEEYTFKEFKKAYADEITLDEDVRLLYTTLINASEEVRNFLGIEIKNWLGESSAIDIQLDSAYIADEIKESIEQSAKQACIKEVIKRIKYFYDVDENYRFNTYWIDPDDHSKTPAGLEDFLQKSVWKNEQKF